MAPLVDVTDVDLNVGREDEVVWQGELNARHALSGMGKNNEMAYFRSLLHRSGSAVRAVVQGQLPCQSAQGEGDHQKR